MSFCSASSHNVLLVYKNISPSHLVSSHTGLGVTAQNAARVLRTAGPRVEVAAVFDGYELRDKLIPKTEPTHVVMFAPWVDTPFLQGLLRKYPHISFAVTYHSNVGFLQADRYAVQLLREQMELELINHNFSLAMNCARLQEAVTGTFGRAATLLPNLYAMMQPKPQNVWLPGSELRLGVFGAMRAQKNMLTAAWGAVQLARSLKTRAVVSINSGRVEGGGESVLGSIRELLSGLDGITLNEAGWMAWARFRAFAASQHLLLSPSYTESFCNVTADGISEGVPSVVTSAIHWAPKSWRADGDSTSDIASVGRRLLRDPCAVTEGYRALFKSNQSGLAAWLAWLDRSRLA
jgi:hypothetical protein